MDEQNMLDLESLALVNGGAADIPKLLKIASSTLGPIVKKWYAEGGVPLVKEKLKEKGLDNLANLFP